MNDAPRGAKGSKMTRKVSSGRVVAIVGGGAGGLELAIRLASSREPAFKVVLVDRQMTHVWKPRLHELATGLAAADDQSSSYLAHSRRHGFEFHWGSLEAVDPVRRTITIGAASIDGAEIFPVRELQYDQLVLALGSKVNDFGTPGVAEHCTMLDSIQDAQRFQQAFIAAAAQVALGRRGVLSIGIVGAGATGVELAAELHHAVRELGQYGGLDAGDKLKITLIDMASRVLPAADERTSVDASASLVRMGINLRLGEGVERVTADAIQLKNGERIPCSMKVWASGVVGHDVLSRVPGLTVARGKRVAVDARLACTGVDGIYALGDCAAAPGADGRGTLPPTAQVAHQQAAYLARALRDLEAGREPRPFVYQQRGMLVSLGEGDAVAELPPLSKQSGKLTSRGFMAKFLYVSLFHMHRVTLHGWWRAVSLFVADRLRGVSLPPVKLH